MRANIFTPNICDHPLVIRHNQRYCRIWKSRHGHKAHHVRLQPRMRDIDRWVRSRYAHSPFALTFRAAQTLLSLVHVAPIHMFPLSNRIELTRQRAKGLKA